MRLPTIHRARTLLTTARYMAGASVANDRHHILVACMPKSGSSLVTRTIGSLPGFRVASIVQGYDRNEQELSELELLRFHNTNYATQNHIRYSAPLARLMADFNMRPLVLTRNIFDVIVSMRDHFKNVSLTWPLAYVPPKLLDRPDEDIDLFIAEMMVPWYLNFFMSWCDCDSAVWLSYETYTTDPLTRLEETLPNLGVNITRAKTYGAIQAADKSRLKTKNKGVPGRGKAVAPAVVDRIYRLSAYYEASVRDPDKKKIFEDTFHHPDYAALNACADGTESFQLGRSAR